MSRCIYRHPGVLTAAYDAALADLAAGATLHAAALARAGVREVSFWPPPDRAWPSQTI